MVANKMSGKDFIALLCLLTFIGLLGYILVDAWISPSEEMENFCKENGYEGATDFKDYRMGNRDYDYKIICDEDRLFEVSSEKTCLKRNKFDECVYNSYELIKYDGNVSYG